jgi:hypothetical protein
LYRPEQALRFQDNRPKRPITKQNNPGAGPEGSRKMRLSDFKTIGD